MLERAWKAGFDVCVLTTDTWQLAWRHGDVANANYAFYHDHGAGDIGLSDPVFLKRCREAGLDPDSQDPQVKFKIGAKWIDEHIWHGKSHSWERLPWVMEQWKRISGGKPFCLKGIQSVADARKAVEAGVDGIVVSNHAGRQVDGAVASLDALEEIVKAVGDKTYVRFPLLPRFVIASLLPSDWRSVCWLADTQRYIRSCSTPASAPAPTSSRRSPSARSSSLSAASGSGASRLRGRWACGMS